MTRVFGDKMGKPAPGWRYEKCIPSDPDCTATIVELLLDQLEKAGWGNRDTFGIHLAMEEAIMNAIRHGNKCDPEKEVQIQIEISEDHFYGCITDQGSGFNPADVPDPTAEENLEKGSGRGVMMINNFVDEATYNAKGNSVVLKKKRSQ